MLGLLSDSCSLQTKSISSDSTEKAADVGESRPYHKSVIMANSQAILPADPLKPPPIKKEKRDRPAPAAASNSKPSKTATDSKSHPVVSPPDNATKGKPKTLSKLTTSEKGPRLKARKSGAMSLSAAEAAVFDLETIPAEPKPLISPARFKPAIAPKAADVAPISPVLSPFTEPPAPLRRSTSQEKPEPRRSRSRDSLDSNVSAKVPPPRRRRTSGSAGVATFTEVSKAVRPKESKQQSTMEIVKSPPPKPKQTRRRGQKRKSTDSLTQSDSVRNVQVLTCPTFLIYC